MKYALFIVIVAVLWVFFNKRHSIRPQRFKNQKIVVGKNVKSTICPYCNYSFQQKPKRNRKCPSCKKKIILRSGALVTEEQAEGYDEKKYAEIAERISAYNWKALIRYKKSGVIKYVEITATETSCNACLMLVGKRFLLSDELKNPTLPVKNCTGGYGYCRCAYIAVVE